MGKRRAAEIVECTMRGKMGGEKKTESFFHFSFRALFVRRDIFVRVAHSRTEKWEKKNGGD
jgi:cytoplasmic iron level regulating protein YaaA (DUF328/UPF0246 family)